jgi:hypothetical protein
MYGEDDCAKKIYSLSFVLYARTMRVTLNKKQKKSCMGHWPQKRKKEKKKALFQCFKF